MSSKTEKRHLVAIMFTDMVGYSALAQRNEALALTLVEEHRELIRGILPKHQGKEIQTTGDGFLVDFASALAAVQCALEIQRALAQRNAALPLERHLNIRIGIHLSDVVQREGDVMGDGVNIAARLEPLAEPGGICLSRAVFEQVQGKLVEGMSSMGELSLKNLTRPMEVFRVELDRSPAFTSAAPSRKSVAVLPFLNMSSDEENEFLAEGITEDLIMALSCVKGLRVPARTSSFAFKGKNEDIRRIGQLLNVETVLEGSVRRSCNKLRITAQLVKVCDGFHLWSERFDREMNDVFDIQDDISHAIVSALEVQLGDGLQTKFVRQRTANTAAYELYVKGRVYWHQRGLGLKKALHYFELALLEDPDYALAWSGLADAYTTMGFYDFLPCREALAKARAAAERAVSLDEHCAEAHSALGLVLGFMDWNSTGAKMEMEKALNLNPSYSPAHCWCAGFLAEEGREEEALEHGRLAVACDPLSVFVNAHLGWMHIHLQRFDAALAPLRRCLELDPNAALARWLLGQASWFTGQREAALTEFQRAADLSERAPMMLSSLGWALALSGQTSRAREIQRELTEHTVPARTRPLFLAILHAAFSEHDLAFAALEQALAERELWLPLARTIAGFTSLTTDRRWPEFVSKVLAVRRASSNGMPAPGSKA